MYKGGERAEEMWTRACCDTIEEWVVLKCYIGMYSHGDVDGWTVSAESQTARHKEYGRR